jgi:hypothetical protein
MSRGIRSHISRTKCPDVFCDQLLWQNERSSGMTIPEGEYSHPDKMSDRPAVRAAHRSGRPAAEKLPPAPVAPILQGPWFSIPLSPVCQDALRPGQVTGGVRAG